MALVTTLERPRSGTLLIMGRYDGRWQLCGLALLQPSITNFPFHVKKKVYKVAQAPLLILQSEQPQDSRPALPAPSWQMSEEACLGREKGGPGGGVGPQSMKSEQCIASHAP